MLRHSSNIYWAPLRIRYYLGVTGKDSVSHSVVSDSLQSHELYSPPSRQEYWSGLPFPFPGGSSQPRNQTRVSSIAGRFCTVWVTRSPTWQVDSLLSEPSGKSMNTGVGSLSLLQGIVLTQELNWGLLRCKQILYQLCYQESTGKDKTIHNLQQLSLLESITIWLNSELFSEVSPPILIHAY